MSDSENTNETPEAPDAPENPMDFSQYMIDVPIPMSDRITAAVQTSMAMLFNALTTLILVPVAFFRQLFTKTQKVVDLGALPKNHPLLMQSGLAEPGPIQHEHRMVQPEPEEDWLKEHRENFGDDLV
jgi:hypothetical protein